MVASSFAFSTGGSFVTPVRSVAGSCVTATSRSSIFCFSTGGSCVSPVNSVDGSCGAATCYTSSWVSTFDKSTAGSCGAAASFERYDVTKS